LDLTARGFKALRLVGLKERAEKLTVLMEGRIIHPLEGDEVLLKYSGREGESVNSITRESLNGLLFDEAEKLGNIELVFNATCEKIDFEK
jgi:kynurenine 3-monooxygenase